MKSWQLSRRTMLKNSALTAASMTIRNGRAVPSEATGLGIAWDWEKIDRLRIDGATRVLK